MDTKITLTLNTREREENSRRVGEEEKRRGTARGERRRGRVEERRGTARGARKRGEEQPEVRGGEAE